MSARPSLPPLPAKPAGSPRLRERPAPVGPGGEDAYSLLLRPQLGTRKVARAEEAGGEEGKREAEAWTRRAAASARRGGELRTEEPPPPAARLCCLGGGCGGGGGGGQKVSATASIPFSCKRALLTSTIPLSPPAKRRGIRTWGHPSYLTPSPTMRD
uniref:Putative uncharacterized protein SERTAD4-AS1 n=1 Tax=Homo sapiens TaxID=9606 RepID=SEAS1_HUMAN|nr:RecName: Full=Putative uncharacterized protein SERTAD4-AS1; AltName: Full=SERTAD4 antisense RNA 1; AltName: Full=SERTAD4 antisense gene protein 1 [Homo sapiens]